MTAFGIHDCTSERRAEWGRIGEGHGELVTLDILLPRLSRPHVRIAVVTEDTQDQTSTTQSKILLKANHLG